MFAMVFKRFYVFFQVFQKHVSNVSSIFRCMLQVLHLDVSKLDRVLHMGHAWEVGEAASGLRVQPGGAATSSRRGPCVGVRNANAAGVECWHKGVRGENTRNVVVLALPCKIYRGSVLGVKRKTQLYILDYLS
jgi:hypothetical protein